MITKGDSGGQEVVINEECGINIYTLLYMSFPGGTRGKEPVCQCRRHKRYGFNPWVRKTPWRRKWQLTPVFLPGKSHGQKSLVGYSPWGCRVRHDLATKSYWIMRWCFLQIQGVKRMRSPADVTEIIRTLKLIQVSSGFSPWTFP